MEIDPTLGSGIMMIGLDGLPVALVWAWVDDFLIHAPMKAKLIVALDAVMDDALRLGLICQKVKTKPPAQVQKYCVFLYDTHGSLEFWVPPEKQSQALAMIGYLRAGVSSLDISILTLAVVMGLLQSLVEATPDRVGQTYL